MPERSRSTASDARHEPVLLADVVSIVAPKPGATYVDGTVGLGGHAAGLLAAGAGRVLGLDRDARALEVAREKLAEFEGRFELVHRDYRDLARVLGERGIDAVDGIVLDLGVSSMQLDDPARGFSFRQSGPLDMRMDPSSGEPLSRRLADVGEEELARVIYEFGEERHSRRVARAIVAARDRGGIGTTTDLAAVVRRAAGGGKWQRLDPATRTFQALRIWTNTELEGLDASLESAVKCLGPGGRLAVIAFHSLEDRIVKQTLRRLAAEKRAALVARKPIVPGDEEVARNPRARSARLRAVEKVA